MNLSSINVIKDWQTIALPEGRYILQNKSTGSLLLYEGTSPNDDDALVLYPGRAMVVVVSDAPIAIKSTGHPAKVAVATA